MNTSLRPAHPQSRSQHNVYYEWSVTSAIQSDDVTPFIVNHSEMHFCWKTNIESEKSYDCSQILNCPMIIFTDSVL